LNDLMGFNEALDVKLCTLISLCKESGNYGQLAEVGLTLIENIVNEKCIPLKFNKVGKEPVFTYMEKVNEIINDNLGITIFEEDLVKRVRTCILSLSRSGTTIPLRQVKEIFSVYYDIMKIDIPNLYDKGKSENLKLELGDNHSTYQSFMSGDQEGKRMSFKKKNQDPIVSMMLNQMNSKEKELRSNFQKTGSKDYMLGLLKLKRDKNTITRLGSKKKILKGNINDDLEYRLSLNKIPGLAVLGLAIVFFLLATLLTIQSTIFPQIMMVFSTFILLFFLGGAVLSYLYNA